MFAAGSQLAPALPKEKTFADTDASIASHQHPTARHCARFSSRVKQLFFADAIC